MSGPPHRPSAADSNRLLRPDSPCNSICTLDDANCCLGCHRTLDEIMGWTHMNTEEQWAVIDNLAVRRKG